MDQASCIALQDLKLLMHDMRLGCSNISRNPSISLADFDLSTPMAAWLGYMERIASSAGFVLSHSYGSMNQWTTPSSAIACLIHCPVKATYDQGHCGGLQDMRQVWDECFKFNKKNTSAGKSGSKKEF